MAKKKSSTAKATAAPPESSSRKSRHAKTSPPPTDAPQSSDSPVFFWKEDEDNGFLCQWYRCTFTDPELEGLTFNCAEQYMMYRKAMLFNDTDIAAKIMKCTSPRKQKGLAREVADYDEAKWCEERRNIVRRGNVLKFSQCTNVASMKMDDEGDPVPLKKVLLATGDRELAEASPFDAVWGIGFKAEEALLVARSRWGENLLGEALMDVRRQLREEAGMDTSFPTKLVSLETLQWLGIRNGIAREIWDKWLENGETYEGLRGEGGDLGKFARDFLELNRFECFYTGDTQINWSQHLHKLGANEQLSDAIANCDDRIRLQQTAAQWIDFAISSRWDWLIFTKQAGGSGMALNYEPESTMNEALSHTYDRSQNLVVDAQNRSLDYIPLWRCSTRVRAENLWKGEKRSGNFSLRTQRCRELTDFALDGGQLWTPDRGFVQLYARYIKKIVHPAPICLVRMELPQSIISKYTTKELRYPNEDFKRTVFHCRRGEKIKPVDLHMDICRTDLLIGDMSAGLNDKSTKSLSDWTDLSGEHLMRLDSGNLVTQYVFTRSFADEDLLEEIEANPERVTIHSVERPERSLLPIGGSCI